MLADAPMWVADVLRTVAFFIGGAAIAVAALIAYKYERVYRAARRSGGNWKGLLPRHVRNVSLAHGVALGWLMYETLLRLDGDLTWRPPLMIALSSYTLYALSDVARYRSRKVHSTIETVTTETSTVEGS